MRADSSCQGYTYNAAKRVCFLKDSVGKAKRFKGAISGRKTAADATAERSVASPGTATFEVFDNADMPGGDFDVLRDTSLEQCQQICAGMPQCQAFTQNMAKNVCFLKSGQASRSVLPARCRAGEWRRVAPWPARKPSDRRDLRSTSRPTLPASSVRRPMTASLASKLQAPVPV